MKAWLAWRSEAFDMWGMFDEPYLETCCRAALHRLVLSCEAGRPAGLKDGHCLERLTGMRLTCRGVDERYRVTEAGRARHAQEILVGVKE